MPLKRASYPSSINTRPAAKPEAPTTPGSELQDQTNLQSPPLSPLLYTREDKDALAFQHDRQQYLKTLDRARNKARKAFSLTPGGLRSSAIQQRTSHHGARERSVTVGDDDKEAEFWMPVDDGVLVVNNTALVGTTDDLETPHNAVGEVRLADLVHTGKTRSGKKGNRGLGGEYEFIPHIRSVIVLDDNQLAKRPRDMEVDDAWECIDGDEDGSKPLRATYASIAAAALTAGN